MPSLIPLPAGLWLDTVGWAQTPLVVRQLLHQMLEIIHGRKRASRRLYYSPLL